MPLVQETTLAALPTVGVEVSFGTITPNFDRLDAYVDPGSSAGITRLIWRLYATVGAVTAKIDETLPIASDVPYRPFAGIPVNGDGADAATLYELRAVAVDAPVPGPGVIGGLCGFDDVVNNQPMQIAGASLPLVYLTEIAFGSLASYHSQIQVQVNPGLAVNARSTWRVYGKIAGAGGTIRALVASAELPAGPLQPSILIRFERIGASGFDLTAELLDNTYNGAPITANISGSDPKLDIVSGGGGVTGPNNANAYFGSTGNLTGVSDFLAGALDAFQRPGVRDFRLGPTNRGAVYKLGAWGVDGDPQNVTSEGYVTYGPNALGNGPDGSQGGLGFYTPNSFGALQIIPGVNGGNPFYSGGFEDGGPAAPFGLDGFALNDDNAAPIFYIKRSTGFIFIGQSGPLHGSGSEVQMSSIVASRAQYRANQYGNNTGVPGISTFKSRGATVGSLGGVLPGDVLFGATCVGVAPDNASIPLAGLIRIQVPTAFVPAGQNWTPSEYELQLVPLAGPINSRRPVFKVTSEGETETLRGVRAGGRNTVPANLTTGALWSSGTGDPNGVVTGSPGDLYSRQDGGPGTCFYVKESGVGTNTGWVGK